MLAFKTATQYKYKEVQGKEKGIYNLELLKNRLLMHSLPGDLPDYVTFRHGHSNIL